MAVTNTLGYYNPAYYANEALIHLWKNLGLASRVHLGFDAERRTFGKGDTINIKKPSTFSAQSAPGSAANTTTQSVQISLSSWQEVRFSLTDKEMAYTGEQIIRDHVAPAAYALANKIDQDLAALAVKIPHAVDEGGTAMTKEGLLDVRERQRDLAVPLYDASNMHFMVGGREEADLLALTEFAQFQGSGGIGVNTQITGDLGMRYGYNFFVNQNRPTRTYANHADGSGTISEPAAVGDTSITVAGMGASKSYKAGTVVQFANGDEYVLLNDETTAAGETGTWEIYPAIRTAQLDNATITTNTAQVNQTCLEPFAFHRNAFALAMAKLPDYGDMANGLGLQVASIQDPVTGLALRSRIHYLGASSAIEVVLDCLYGVQILDGDLACRLLIDNA